MADGLTYEECVSYARKLQKVTDGAVRELSENIARIDSSDPYTRAYAIRRNVAYVAERYGVSAQELGAQWYDYCARKAGVNTDAAEVGEINYNGIDAHFENLLDAYANGDESWEHVEPRIRSAFEDEMRNLSRETIIGNLDRDERQSRRRRYRQTARAEARAGYARVPVGETCAWCIMLASLGYYYRSEETALGVEPDHYHAHCDCIAVPYHGPGAIEGYDDYEMYFDIYATARDTFNSGNYSRETAERIERAREEHGYRSNRPWTDYNAILIIMREQQGLEH